MNVLTPISEEDELKPYYKYYLEPMAPVAPEVYEKAAASRLTPEEVLDVHDMNRLFEPGYLPGEQGYCSLPDGTAYMSNLMFFKDVTAEMFDWWFAWHILETLRYRIWNPEDHLFCMTRNPEQVRDPNLSYRERIWNTICDVTEGFGAEPRDVVIPFIHPVDMGFDRNLYEKLDGTIIAMAAEDNRTISCHFIRTVDGGVELRTRFWFGLCLRDGKPDRFDDTPLPEQLPKSLLMHNIKEFTNLARLLPRLYPEERDNF